VSRRAVVVPAGKSATAICSLVTGSRPTQSVSPGSVNEYQLRLGRQRQVWLIPIADECVGVQVKL